MPVTARLSRRFYERFGDEIANELVEWFNSVDATYRADLKGLNDLNFERFDAKVEQRFAEADAKVERRLSQLETRMLRWMFGLWTGSMITLAAFMMAILRAVRG